MHTLIHSVRFTNLAVIGYDLIKLVFYINFASSLIIRDLESALALRIKRTQSNYQINDTHNLTTVTSESIELYVCVLQNIESTEYP